MKKRQFDAVVELGHKGCGIILPFDPSSAWGRRRRHFVRGTLNDARFEAEIGLRWGRFFTVVGDEVLDALRLAPGATVAVTMQPRPPNELDPPKAPRLPSIRLLGRASQERPRRSTRRSSRK